MSQYTLPGILRNIFHMRIEASQMGIRKHPTPVLWLHHDICFQWKLSLIAELRTMLERWAWQSYESYANIHCFWTRLCLVTNTMRSLLLFYDKRNQGNFDLTVNFAIELHIYNTCNIIMSWRWPNLITELHYTILKTRCILLIRW